MDAYNEMMTSVTKMDGVSEAKSRTHSVTVSPANKDKLSKLIKSQGVKTTWTKADDNKTPIATLMNTDWDKVVAEHEFAIHKLGVREYNKSKTESQNKEENMQIQESVFRELTKEGVQVTTSKSITTAYMAMFEKKEDDVEVDDQTDVEIEKDVKEELSDKQKELDKDGDGDIEADDLKKLRDEEDMKEGELPPALKAAIDKKKGKSDDKEDVKEAKSGGFATFVAKNVSISGKEKNDVDELDAVKKIMKAKNMDAIKKIVINDYHSSEQEFQKMQSDFIIASL